MSILILHLDEEEGVRCFAWFVLLSCDCCVALPYSDVSLSAVCACGIS